MRSSNFGRVPRFQGASRGGWPRCFACRQRQGTKAAGTLCLPCHDNVRPGLTAAPLKALFAYRGPLRALILAAKTHADPTALAGLCALADAALRKEPPLPTGVLVPCPSSLAGRWRGQLDVAHLWAWHLTRTGPFTLEKAPHRLFFGRSKQAPIPRGRRGSSLPETLALWRQRSESCEPASLLLVDDVVTTGGSLERLARALGPRGESARFLTLAGPPPGVGTTGHLARGGGEAL